MRSESIPIYCEESLEENYGQRHGATDIVAIGFAQMDNFVGEDKNSNK